MRCAPSFSWGIVPPLQGVPGFNNDLQSQIAQPTSLWCHCSEIGLFLHTDRCWGQPDSLFTDITGSSEVLLLSCVWLLGLLNQLKNIHLHLCIRNFIYLIPYFLYLIITFKVYNGLHSCVVVAHTYWYFYIYGDSQIINYPAPYTDQSNCSPNSLILLIHLIQNPIFTATLKPHPLTLKQPKEPDLTKMSLLC